MGTCSHRIGGPEIRSRAVLARPQPAVTVPTNPSQVASNRRHFATIGVTVPTKPAKSICIRGDDNIGRMSDGQQSVDIVGAAPMVGEGWFDRRAAVAIGPRLSV